MQSFAPGTEAVLDQAFRHTIDRPWADDVVQRFIQEHRARVYTPFDTPEFTEGPQGILRRIGVQRAQELFQRHSTRLDAILEEAATLPEITPPTWEVVSAVEILAEINLAIAGQHMPEELVALAAAWPNADLEGQIEICRKVYAALRSASEEAMTGEEFDAAEVNESWVRDYVDQPVERIFPRLFLQGDGKPNCLGKAQLLAAFCRKIGVTYFGFTPIQIAQDMTNHVLLQLSAVIESISKELDADVPKRLKAAFARRDKARQVLNAAPSRFHMGVVLQLKDDSWYMIDPHMAVHGLLSNPDEMSYNARQFGIYESPLPGFCCLHAEGKGLMEFSQRAEREAAEPINYAGLMTERWKESGYDLRVIVSLLANSPALEILVREKVGIPEEEVDKMLEVMESDKFAIMTLGPKDGDKPAAMIQFRNHGDGEITARQYNRSQVAVRVLDYCCQGKFFAQGGGHIDPELVRKGFRRCLGILMAIGYRRATNCLQADDDSAGALHSLIELYEPKFRIGIELLAHVNAIGAQSDEVVTDLARLCGGQHHLMLAATEHIRANSGSPTELGINAARALQHALLRLPDAEEALASFPASGQLQPTGV